MLLAVLAPLAACATAARGNLEPIVTDRPDFTESSEIVPSGLLQLESGGTYSRDGDERAGSLGEALIRVGLAPRAELRVGLNSYAFSQVSGSTVRGLEDASLGAKFNLFDGGALGSVRPKVSLIVHSTLPTGAQPFRANKMQPQMKLIGAWTLSERFAFASNLNYAVVRERFDSYAEPSASASVAIGLSQRVGSYVEYFGFYPQQEGLDKSHYMNGGLTYGLSDNLQLDARAGRQVQRLGDGQSWFMGVGIARRW
jgi:hypothetical protein